MTVACDEVWGKIGVYEAMEISSRCAEVKIWQEGPTEEGFSAVEQGLREEEEEGEMIYFSSRLRCEIKRQDRREGES